MPGADERMDPELLVGHYANYSSEQAKLEDEMHAKLAGLVKRKEQVEAADRERLQAMVRELREAGSHLQAALWDAHYGKGISLEYIQSVDAKWLLAKARAESLAGSGERSSAAESRGALDVLAERQRQIAVEGWTDEHDDAFLTNELIRAAICYLMPKLYEQFWPWDYAWWKPKGRRRNLVRAAALVIAELDRMDRGHGHYPEKPQEGTPPREEESPGAPLMPAGGA